MSDIKLNQIDVQRLKLEPGEILVVKLSGMDDLVTVEDMESLKASFQVNFPNNKILMMSLPEDGKVDLTVAKPSEYPALNYCDDCSCGKKAAYEGK